MTKRRAIGLIAPITVGPALVGMALLYRCGADQEGLRWDERDKTSLVNLARRPNGNSSALRITLPEADKIKQPASVRTKVQARSTTSDHALVGKMVPPPTLAEPVFELPRPTFGPAARDRAAELDRQDRLNQQGSPPSFAQTTPPISQGAGLSQEIDGGELVLATRDPPAGGIGGTIDDIGQAVHGVEGIAVLAEGLAPIVISPELDLPLPSFGLPPEAEIALAATGAAVEEGSEEIALAQPAEDLVPPAPSAFSFADTAGSATHTDPISQPSIDQPGAEPQGELAGKAILDPSYRSAPGISTPQIAQGSVPAQAHSTGAPEAAYAAMGPSKPRPAAATLAYVAGAHNDNDAQDRSATSIIPDANPARPVKAGMPAASQPVELVNYKDLPQARAGQLSVKALLPEENASGRTSIARALAQTARSAGAGARQAGTSDPAMADIRENDFSPGRQTFPVRAGEPAFTYEDELILQFQVAGISVNDTIIAYGNRDGVYLPLGELGRILDLAIRVSDDGHYASGWFLSEDRTLTIDLRNGTLTTAAGTRPILPGYAVAFDGEMFLRAEAFGDLLPLTVATDLRAQRIVVTTLEPFPFEERMRRENARARLNARNALPDQREWPREETPYLPFSIPMADIELRGVSDTARGTRAEGDLRLAGDLAWMTAQSYLSTTTRDGLVAALLELGRKDPDGDLLGPIQATEFQLGDVSTTSMVLGLRGTAGRGAYVTNQPFESVSVFDRIDVRGVLPDGYEVELYRNDILLGSTRDAVNGQYEFLQVPVDYGLNVFRLVFYGPQGQRREEVRRVSVGDGRLAQGQLVYSLGAIQRGVNLLGVTGPDFRPGDRYGDWQSVAELAYGVTPGLTAVASAALFEDTGANRWIGGMGLRSGIGGYALRADAGLSDGGGHAVGLGVGGRALNGAFTLSHFEYGGGFIDETHAFTSEPLRRATELDFNTSLNVGGVVSATYLPITFRGRHLEFANGQKQTNASLRSSMRLPGMITSNTFEFSRNASPVSSTVTQLFGNFDLATFSQSDTQLRGSLGYRISPNPRVTTVTAEANHALDDKTVVRGSAAYSFMGDEVSLGLSAIREFERFTLALDGRYSVREGDYSVALRLGFSLGHDPKRNRVFLHRPGLASSGAVSVRVFQDVDGDGVFGTPDKRLPEVGLAVHNNSATTNADGFAMLGELGDGNRVSVQIDQSTLPDLLMAPVNPGIEIIPRAGRIHQTDFPIVELSEVEGSVTFVDEGSGRGVSGLRLQLVDRNGEAQHFVRTERGGYYFFEQVKPGIYAITIDPEQAQRLGICLSEAEQVTVLPTGDIISRDLKVRACDAPANWVGNERPPAPPGSPPNAAP